MANKRDYEQFEDILSKRVLYYTQQIFQEILTISREMGIELTDDESIEYLKYFTESINRTAEIGLERGRGSPTHGRGGPHDGSGGAGAEKEKKYVEVTRLDELTQDLKNRVQRIEEREKELKDWQHKLERRERELKEKEKRLQNMLEEIERKASKGRKIEKSKDEHQAGIEM